jgi:small subunit ribosomal protein S5
MTDTITKEAEVQTAETTEEVVAPAVDAAPAKPTERPRRGGQRSSRPRERAPRERSEFDQVTIDVRRVARVMAGGRRFSFSVVVVIGDRKGRVGVGIGKGADTALSIDKAVRDARRNLITVPRTPDGSIAHEVTAILGPTVLTIVPSPGRGLVAGSAMRTVLELAGIGNVITKILSRSKNKLSIARATINALKTVGTRS